MTCQILFSGKNKKNISKCCLLKILPRVLSVNHRNFETIAIIKTNQTPAIGNRPVLRVTAEEFAQCKWTNVTKHDWRTNADTRMTNTSLSVPFKC